MSLLIKQLTNAIIVTALIVNSFESISAENLSTLAPSQPVTSPLFLYAQPHLWQYLRSGLNYLESPQPLAAPEAVLPTYVHPDYRGFGAYGFSPEAYEDVRRRYPFFQDYSWQDILRSPALYDLANQAFADWLLKNLQEYLPAGATEEEIFDVLQQAWNLGLSGFKIGGKTVASRMRRAEEFKRRRSF